MSESLPPATEDALVAEGDRMVIYGAILVALFLAALDQTIVPTALPRMVEDLQGIDRYAWVATAYLLAYGPDSYRRHCTCHAGTRASPPHHA